MGNPERVDKDCRCTYTSCHLLSRKITACGKFVGRNSVEKWPSHLCALSSLPYPAAIIYLPGGKRKERRERGTQKKEQGGKEGSMLEVTSTLIDFLPAQGHSVSLFMKGNFSEMMTHWVIGSLYTVSIYVVYRHKYIWLH